MKKVVIMAVLVTVLSAGFAHAALLNDRGTRAFSMEGAFVAQADDSSALWYNPAGLVQSTMPKLDVTFQKLSPASSNVTTAYDMQSSSWAANFKYVGIGMNYVNYDYDLQPKQHTTEFSFGFGTNFGTKRFSLGLTGGNLEFKQDATATAPEFSESTSQFVFGALLKILDFDNFGLSLGIAKRPQADDGKNFIYRADSAEYGLHATIITGMPIIGVNLQQDKVSYNYSDILSTLAASDNGYDQTTLGLEVTFPFSENFTFAVRLGHRTNSWDKTSTVSPTGGTSTFANVNSTSYGIGISAGKHFAFDLGQRATSYSDSRPEFKSTTGSISLLF